MYSNISEEEQNLRWLLPNLTALTDSAGLASALLPVQLLRCSLTPAGMHNHPTLACTSPSTKRRGNRGLENDSGWGTVRVGEVKGAGTTLRGSLPVLVLGSWVTPLLPLPSYLKTQKSEIVQTSQREDWDKINQKTAKTLWMLRNAKQSRHEGGLKMSMKIKFKDVLT